MPHARTQIRTAVVAALGATAIPVITSRVYPDGGPLPSLTVYTSTEETEQDEDEAMGEDDQSRRLVLTVEARVKDTVELDDALDDACLAVEQALGADVTLGGLAEWLSIRGTEYERTGEQEQPLGVATMAYQIDYIVDRTDPGQIVP